MKVLQEKLRKDPKLKEKMDKIHKHSIAYSNEKSNKKPKNNRGDKAVMETWAETVELVATLERYENKFGNVNYQYRGNLQTKSVNLNDPYTSLGYDLIDTLNQNSINISRPIDNVNSFTINEIENSLKGVTGWLEWRDNIKQKYPTNPSIIFVDELFLNWNF